MRTKNTQSRFAEWWLDRCDFHLGRVDEWMALAYIVERVLLAVAALWWLYAHSPVTVGLMINGVALAPVVAWARRGR